MAFLHGVEVIELNAGPRPIQTAASSIIGLVGISDTADVNELILVSSDNDLAQFGDPVKGNTIARALKAIFDQGGATCLVVNVYNSTDHRTTITNEDVTASGSTYKGLHPFYADVVVKDSTGVTTYDLNDDYIVEDYVVKRVSGSAFAEGAALKISYKYLNETLVADADLFGTVGEGLELFDTALTQFGITPKILIAPYFASDKQVADALIAKAASLKAVTLLDTTETTVSGALTHRGDATKSFGTNSQRALLCFPSVEVDWPIWTQTANSPYSMYLAGVIANSDNNPSRGYWYTPSNVNVLGINKPSTTITFDLSNPSTQANLLNAAGICTIVSSYGTGWLAWGQRNASFPTSTLPTNFISVRRTADIIHLSVIASSLQYIGQPITGAIIDAIKESVNEFLRALIQRGAIVDGSKCNFRAVDNPPASIAAGQLTFQIEMLPSPSLERLTFKSTINTNLASNLTV
jgi:phage tail sheath protein FI